MMETGFFGGRKLNLIEEPKKATPNLLEAFKGLMDGIKPPVDLLVPILAWSSNTKKNIGRMQVANRNFFYASKNVLMNYIVLNVDRNQRFIKYPKAKKEEHELSFIIPYIQRYYGWSDREWEFNKEFIDLEDAELHQMLHRLYVFEDKERKKLGIKKEKINAKFEGHKKVKGFF